MPGPVAAHDGDPDRIGRALSRLEAQPSGSTIRNRAPASIVVEAERAAVDPDQLGRDRQAEAGAAGTRRALERREQVLPGPRPAGRGRCRRPGWSPGRARSRLAATRTAASVDLRPVQRLHGVAHEVGRAPGRAARNRPGPRRSPAATSHGPTGWAASAARSGQFRKDRRQRRAGQTRRALGDAPIGEGRLAEADRPAERPHEARAPRAAPSDRRCLPGGRPGAARR